MLANRPGHPFLGNDLFRECGDVFATHVIDSPDAAGEAALLASIAPRAPRAMLRRVAGLFAELRAHVAEGLLAYPYSTREAVSIARHLEAYPHDGLVGAGPIAEEEVYKWWHPEGCAISIGSLAVSAVFILPFEFFWTLWCLRLAKLVLNIKMRRRLLVVQLTYTFIPGAVLLLRASKIFIQANHQGVSRHPAHLLTLRLSPARSEPGLATTPESEFPSTERTQDWLAISNTVVGPPLDRHQIHVSILAIGIAPHESI